MLFVLSNKIRTFSFVSLLSKCIAGYIFLMQWDSSKPWFKNKIISRFNLSSLLNRVKAICFKHRKNYYIHIGMTK